MQSSLYNSGNDITTRPSSTALLVLDSNDRAYYSPLPVWNSYTSFIAGNEVFYNGEVYVCINNVLSFTPPDVDTANWDFVSESRFFNYTIGGDSAGYLFKPDGVASGNPTGQPYNNFRIQKSQPLLQGGFSRICVGEITYNFNLPNINDYTNFFYLGVINTSLDPPAVVYKKIQIANGYYSGSQLQTAVQSAINTAFPSGSGYTITITFNSSLGFTIAGNYTSTLLGSTDSTYLLPYDPNTEPPANYGATMLDVMGFNPRTNWNYCNSGLAVVKSVGASLLYTTYIDFISNKLTYYQKVSDQSTRRNAGSNVICRLYLTDNTSQPNQFSPLPYIITRQFNNAKSIRWDKNTAIDWCDISLLDDSGRPLYYDPQVSMSGDFQITLLASED